MNKSRVNKEDPHSTSKKNPTNFYKSSDLYLSAFLKSKGVILHNIKRSGNRVVFVFRDDGNVPDLVKEYFNDGIVKVLSFKASLADLRSIIFNYEDP